MPLALAEIQKRIINLNGWTLGQDGKSISRTIDTDGFTSAASLIGKIAVEAEALDHHPDVHLTGYKHLQVVLTTHDAGGVTERDFKLASKIDGLTRKPS